MAHLAKAKGFERERNFPQSLHHAELAATKLKQLKDRPVELIDKALSMKYGALAFTGQHKEALECAKEWYCLYPTNHTHPPAIIASFAVIESCLFNKEYFDAALYARTLWETITMSRDSHIPDDKREEFTARGAMELARATLQLAQSGGMPAEEQQGAGVEAIMLARRALEINSQLYGADDDRVAACMGELGSILSHFIDVDDDEVPRLFEQSKAIHVRVHGNLSSNVAACEKNLGITYYRRSRKAQDAHDLDVCIANLKLALPHYREAARIYRAANHVDKADDAARNVVAVEELLQRVVAERAAASRG